MRLFGLSDEKEAFAKLGRQRLGVIAADIEVTAAPRPVVGEAGDDEVASGPDRLPGQVDIVPSVRRIDQKVEHGPVMPDIERTEGLSFGDIGYNPIDRAGTLAEPRPGRAQRGLGDVEDGDFLERDD
jgi:hypothetical protein